MKLDPEERIIAAALDQAALNQANERGAGARIEFSRDGHAGLPDNRVGLTARGVDYGSTADQSGSPACPSRENSIRAPAPRSLA